MFGEWSDTITKVGATIVVIILLIAVAYWLVRRFASGGLGRISRGRVPRLAVVDATPVDRRRRLVLVRRDNVEHLILIGGPSDIVIEPSIVRARRPVARPPGSAPEGPSTAPPAEAEAPVTSQAPPVAAETRTVPDVAAREPVAPRQPMAQPQVSPAADRSFFPLRRTGAARPARSDQTSASASGPAEPSRAAAETPQTGASDDDIPAGEMETAAATNGHGQRTAVRAEASDASPTPAVATTTEPASDETTEKVNNLEREMARLLGEITGKHPT